LQLQKEILQENVKYNLECDKTYLENTMLYEFTGTPILQQRIFYIEGVRERSM
jgi:hypothetical protein